jgi:hypothetical protein
MRDGKSVYSHLLDIDSFLIFETGEEESESDFQVN